ncbi:hypothetical protein DXG01_015311 [Tephrocybe rancida]|nr:hypothetical protein DXG01_015311 [Tephrocybe rancida]
MIFAGLFSATITAFIIESYKLLKQDSNDVTNVLLTQLLTAQIAAAAPNSSVASPLALPTFDFTPSPAVIAVNILWFLSLCCSLIVALGVTLVQEWVRDYMHSIQRHNQPIRRAKIRTVLFNGRKRWLLDFLVAYIPTLLHVSLFLFFCSLYIFLTDVNTIVSRVVGAGILSYFATYAIATFAPLIDPSAPYRTPLASLIWRFCVRFAHRPHAHYKTPLSANLAIAREQIALNPHNKEKSFTLGAQAIVWTIDMTTSDRELETFLESIPGLLSSPDGRRTWTTAFRGAQSNALQNRIFRFLGTCLTAMDPKLRQIRASICTEALFAITQCEMNQLPKCQPERTVMDGLSQSLVRASEGSHRISTSMGLCAPTLMACQDLKYQFHNHTLPDNIVTLSRRADRALRDVTDMQRTLDEVLEGLASDPLDHRLDIQNLLQTYFAVVNSKAQDLLEWPLLKGMRELPQSGSLLSWVFPLPRTRCSVKYHNISGLGSAECELYSHHVLAYLRGIEAYPQLSDASQSPSTLSPIWFPHLKDGTLEVERTLLSRELQSVSLLLDILEPNPRTHQVEVYSPKGEPHIRPSPDRHSITDLSVLTEHLGPFTTTTFILQDVLYDTRTTALLEFVRRFKSLAPKMVESHAIHKLLDFVLAEEPQRMPHSEGSNVLFIAALRIILDWEHEATLDKPCAFSDADIIRLLENLKKNFFHSQLCLETAEKLLGTTFTPAIAGDTSSNTRWPITRTPDATRQDSYRRRRNPDRHTYGMDFERIELSRARLQGVYDYVVAQRQQRNEPIFLAVPSQIMTPPKSTRSGLRKAGYEDIQSPLKDGQD